MWYFAQVAPLDPRAKSLPLPDDLMGRLVEFIVSHEVGHTLGFRHNMKASSLYTVAQIRDKNFVHENGHTPSIMDYARFNYVAQPEDGIAVEDLVPRIGAVRHVRDQVGLHADSGREDAGRREDDARHVGARAGHEAVPAVHDRGPLRARRVSVRPGPAARSDRRPESGGRDRRSA